MNGIELAGTHSYSGSCAPGGKEYISNTTFSLGIFEWIPKKNGKECKRGKVKVRVKGLCQSDKAVYDIAEKICKKLDTGTYKGNKNVVVGTV